MFVSLRRIIKSGWTDFKRQSGLNIAAVFIMVMMISLATSLFLFRETSKILVTTLQEKMNMYVYFKNDLSGEEIMLFQQELVKLPEVKKIEYISKEEALAKFVQKHQDDKDIMESLIELGDNPFLASLDIRAWEPDQYASISGFLSNNSLNDMISKIDYQQKKPVIEKLFSITSTVNRIGIIFGFILAIIAVSIVFNTTRLTISHSREEIETMRLVGASNWFIRGPFLVQGVLVGVLASLIALVLFSVGLFLISPTLMLVFSGFSIFNYYLINLPTIILIQLTAGVGLGIISNWVAVRKYLKV